MKLMRIKSIIILVFSIIYIGCMTNKIYRVNVTNSVPILNDFITPPKFNELYKINTLSKDKVIIEIKSSLNVITYDYNYSNRKFDIVDDNYYVVFNNLKYSLKQFSKENIILMIESLEICDDSLENSYKYIIILEMENSIGYIFLDNNRLFYESNNGNIKGKLM